MSHTSNSQPIMAIRKKGKGNLSELGLSKRVVNVLESAGITSVQELNRCKNLTDIRNIGEKTAVEIKTKLKKYNKNQSQSKVNSVTKPQKTDNKEYKPVGNSESYIDDSFFPTGIQVDTSRIFPVVVMATMSSGKSTLINALLGEDILPSENAACTSKMYSILDDDSSSETTLYVTKKDGKTKKYTKGLSDRLKVINNDDEVADILITGDVKGVINTDKSLLIVDTPGPNNSRNEKHEKAMSDILGQVKGGLILYVINATQMGINDDSRLLSVVREHIKNRGMDVVFVINKMDEIDYETESAFVFMQETKEYLENNGFENSDIIPVSAISAKLFKKVINGEELSRKEYRDFIACYDLFRTSDLNMNSYAITKDNPNKLRKISVNDVEYTYADIEQAIDNTGITLLEKYIQKKQIDSSGIKAIEIKTK